MTDIEGVDKVALLKELWLNSRPTIFFTLHNQNPPQFDEKKASGVVSGYIDYYFQGRCIKCDLSGNTADSYLYNRDFGEDALENIVLKLKK